MTNTLTNQMLEHFGRWRFSEAELDTLETGEKKHRRKKAPQSLLEINMKKFPPRHSFRSRTDREKGVTGFKEPQRVRM